MVIFHSYVSLPEGMVNGMVYGRIMMIYVCFFSGWISWIAN